MDTSKYELSANADFTAFEFVSNGRNGDIHKAIKYTQTLNKDVYNLGFGDIMSNDEAAAEIVIDDSVVSNNGDLQKVIATVVYSIYIFTKRYPEAYVLFGSSDPAKVRLHRMIISRNYEAITKNFLVFGAVHNQNGQLVNVAFDPLANVEGYFVKRR